MKTESRGFIFGVPVAYAQHKGFVPVRKKGKLPCETIAMEYDLAVSYTHLLHIEGLGHVKPVQPYLVGIDFLMPEVSCGCAGLFL